MTEPLIRCDREGLELDRATGIEALYGRDQPEQPVRDEVRLLDVRGQPGGHATGHELHERRVGEHEPLTSPLVAFVLVAAPRAP
ncbi:MAG: hypothetical protein WKF31_03950 [Thermoleophilaceae bacterium]